RGGIARGVRRLRPPSTCAHRSAIGVNRTGIQRIRPRVSDTHNAIDAVWRIESARLIAGLARIVSDVGLAEDLAQDALVGAFEKWPESGVPHNPGAWLMATAKHKAIDQVRRRKMLERKHETLAHERAAQQEL